jgi:uncharacterized protein (TIGR02217 family)
MAFDEVQFPVLISYGSRGGPRFLTDVAGEGNGHESRVSIWGDSSPTYNARWGIKTMIQLLEVITFFYARMGKNIGFRYKDFLDFAVADHELIIDGSNEIQLIRNYVSGPTTHRRTIRKPIAGVTLRRNAAPFSSFTIDLTTGILTLTPDATNSIASTSPFSINDVSQADPAVVETSLANPFIDNDVIKIASVGGMVELVDGEYAINQLTTTTFELIGVDSTGFTAFSSGGTARLHGVSKSSVARVYSVGHGYSTSEIIFIDNIVGMVEMNGLFADITVIDADRFTMPIDSLLFTEYQSAGDAEMHLQPGIDVMDWSGEFDVPVRFDTDSLQASLDAFDIGNIPDIPLIGLFND